MHFCTFDLVLGSVPRAHLPLGGVLSHHKQEAGCVYVSNVENRNVIKYLSYHYTDRQI